MGIYIKGMEMPKNGLYQILDGTIRLYDYQKIIDGKQKDIQSYNILEIEKPHGDLVDHSEIGKILIKALDECEISEADKGHVLRMVWIAPTVIESEVDE